MKVIRKRENNVRILLRLNLQPPDCLVKMSEYLFLVENENINFF